MGYAMIQKYGTIRKQKKISKPSKPTKSFISSGKHSDFLIFCIKYIQCGMSQKYNGEWGVIVLQVKFFQALVALMTLWLEPWVLDSFVLPIIVTKVIMRHPYQFLILCQHYFHCYNGNVNFSTSDVLYVVAGSTLFTVYLIFLCCLTRFSLSY